MRKSSPVAMWINEVLFSQRIKKEVFKSNPAPADCSSRFCNEKNIQNRAIRKICKPVHRWHFMAGAHLRWDKNKRNGNCFTTLDDIVTLMTADAHNDCTTPHRNNSWAGSLQNFCKLHQSTVSRDRNVAPKTATVPMRGRCV